MNSNEKRWIVLLVAVVIIAVVLIVVLVNGNRSADEQNTVQEPATTQEPAQEEQEEFVTQVEDGTKINTSEQFNAERTYNNVQISKIQFTEKDNMSVLLANVTNVGSTKHEREVVKITLLDGEGKTITDFRAVIPELEPNESGQINASITADVANAKDFKVEATAQQ